MCGFFLQNLIKLKKQKVKNMQEFLLLQGTRAFELICAFFIVVVFLKAIGMNYQMKQMSSLDLIINFILSAILAGFIMNDNVHLRDFLVIMALYILIVAVINLVIKKTNFGRRFLVGYPQVIIKDGKVNEREMMRLNISAHALASALRNQKIHSLTEVKTAQLEPSGDLTIVKKGGEDYAVIVIDNGVVDDEALQKIGKTARWLQHQLREKKIKYADDVFIAQWYKNKLHIVKRS
jgi:uncharacterized membrane protein YcaP (DUF421 family)